jgi:hypothetical protein
VIRQRLKNVPKFIFHSTTGQTQSTDIAGPERRIFQSRKAETENEKML